VTGFEQTAISGVSGRETISRPVRSLTGAISQQREPCLVSSAEIKIDDEVLAEEA
jgi:hypothetical protein